ncbi:MAG: Peptidase M50 family protein [Anaerolineales bacterium]|nr:Peptidase M50 family protein [Anaerolineales bacterium]
MLPSNYSVIDPTDLLRAAAERVMDIHDTTLGDGNPYVVRFRGRLRMDSIEAYALVSERFRPLGYTALFRNDGGSHAVLAVKGVIDPPASRTWVNYLMFGLTVLSVLFTGGLYGYQGDVPTGVMGWMRLVIAGWPFVLSMLGILLAHELGHYFVARYHKVAVTLPYFIPLPYLSPFGTMGAFIMLKSPPTNRRVLLDIGIAGPLAGFVVAVPVLIYGLMTSPVQPLTLLPGQGISLEGNSIIYILAKLAIFHQFLPAPASFGNLPPWLYMLRYYLLGFPVPLGGKDVLLNQVAWAGWAGLLVTGLNLIPAGQLDGGHALYVLVGQRARRLVPFIIVILVGLGFFWPGWFLWAGLIYFLGRTHAEPLDQITELDPRRKALAVLALVLFLLVITPIPLLIVGA